jgi:nucleoside-diphosphate-sugar epimerase
MDKNAIKTIAVFGATGRTGSELIKQALDQGYSIKALVRTPSKIRATGSKLQIIQGSATDAAKVDETIKGVDAVVSVLGMVKGSAPDLKVVSTCHIVSAMHTHGVKRFLKMASAPLGVPGEGDNPGLGQKLMSGLIRILMKTPADDDVISCEQLKKSDLEWTIVRAPMLTNAALETSEYKIGNIGSGGRSVSRASVAAFILDELALGRYMRKSPLVYN